jgi:hypothetical protein
MKHSPGSVDDTLILLCFLGTSGIIDLHCFARLIVTLVKAKAVQEHSKFSFESGFQSAMTEGIYTRGRRELMRFE